MADLHAITKKTNSESNTYGYGVDDKIGLDVKIGKGATKSPGYPLGHPVRYPM